MGTEYIMIGIFAVVVVVMIVLLIGGGKKSSSGQKEDASQKSEGKSTNAEKSGAKREDVFKFMEFDRIQDNMIVQNGGKRYTMAIKCKGINYDLMSEPEQMAVEQGFITFLNTLKYPIQLYVQAQNIDLKHVVQGYKEFVSPLEEEYAKYNRLYEEKSGIFDVDKEEIDEITAERTRILNVYEYANDIISYVEKMSINKNLLQRNFYVLVSYSKGDIAAVDKFTKEEVEEMCYAELLTRCNSIISALASSSVIGSVLNSNELADLLYTAYNRDDKTLMGVRDALDSGFYRLYSTSKDAFQKKDEMIKEAIATEARLKAILSLEKAINDDTNKTDTMYELETEEEISKEATDLIQNENLDPEIKQKATNEIMQDYRNTKREVLPKIEEEKRQVREEVETEKQELKEKYENSDVYRIKEHQREVQDEYRNEIKQEKEEIIKIINENSDEKDKIDETSLYGEDDSII